MDSVYSRAMGICIAWSYTTGFIRCQRGDIVPADEICCYCNMLYICIKDRVLKR